MKRVLSVKRFNSFELFYGSNQIGMKLKFTVSMVSTDPQLLSYERLIFNISSGYYSSISYAMLH